MTCSFFFDIKLNMLKEAIFFDLDGTLVDTEKVALDTLREYLVDLNVVLDAADVEFITGRKWDLGVRYLVDRYSLLNSADQIESEVLAAYRSRLRKNLPVIQGAIDFVTRAAKRCRVFCVSGSKRADIEFALKQSEVFPLFESIVGCEDYFSSKPAPDAYLTALLQAKVKPENVLVFEDSPAGVTAALAAGLSVVQISHRRLESASPLLLHCAPNYLDPYIEALLR